MSPTSLAARTLAVESSLQRRSREREPVLARARDMRMAFKLPPTPALAPILILCRSDQV